MYLSYTVLCTSSTKRTHKHTHSQTQTNTKAQTRTLTHTHKQANTRTDTHTIALGDLDRVAILLKLFLGELQGDAQSRKRHYSRRC